MVNPGNIGSFLHLAVALFLSPFLYLNSSIFLFFFSSFLFYISLSLSLC